MSGRRISNFRNWAIGILAQCGFHFTDCSPFFSIDILDEITLSIDDNQGSLREQTGHLIEQIGLRFNAGSTGLRSVHEVKAQVTNVFQGRNRLHLNLIAFLHGPIQKPRSVDELVFQSTIYEVANV